MPTDYFTEKTNERNRGLNTFGFETRNKFDSLWIENKNGSNYVDQYYIYSQVLSKPNKF